jgi:hypothetical protein
MIDERQSHNKNKHMTVDLYFCVISNGKFLGFFLYVCCIVCDVFFLIIKGECMVNEYGEVSASRVNANDCNNVVEI